MFAVGMVRGKPGVHAVEIPMPKIQKDDDVLVRIKEVGLDGTDFGIVTAGTPDIAADRNELVLGHEMTGVVEEIGKGVNSLTPGDVVTMTVRRGCGQCHPCFHNQSDMCMTGLYAERGIHKIDGFLTGYVVDQEQYILKVPSDLARIAVFSEPLSIVEKGIDQIKIIQSRLPWSCRHPDHSFSDKNWGHCKTALVIGAGPLGLLAASLLRLAEVNTFVIDIVAKESPKIHLADHIGAIYVDSRDKSPDEIMKLCTESGTVDIILDASGAAETALKLVNYMSRSSIFVMTGIPKGDLTTEVDAAQLVRQIVRYNQVLVGSVNSNRSHFEMALNDMGEVDANFDGMLGEMITHRIRLEDYEKAFSLDDPKHIKTVIEVDSWT